MALTKTQELYEVLVRFEGGAVKGAHVVDREVIWDGDQEVGSRVLRARGIDPAEVGAVLGSENAARLAEIATLKAECARLTDEAKEARSERNAAKASLNAAKASLAALQARKEEETPAA